MKVQKKQPKNCKMGVMRKFWSCNWQCYEWDYFVSEWLKILGKFVSICVSKGFGFYRCLVLKNDRY